MSEEKREYRCYPVSSSCPCGVTPDNITEEGWIVIEENLLKEGFVPISGGFRLPAKK